MTAVTKPNYSLGQIPGAIWALGFVSMLMDVSSEMIHALLPVYLVTGLGTSMVTVGVIEGIAEATASITKIFSGALSDWRGKRKLLAVLGYGLAAFTKPVFPLVLSAAWFIGARFVDRVGKGIADASPPELRGTAHVFFNLLTGAACLPPASSLERSGTPLARRGRLSPELALRLSRLEVS